MHDDLFSRDEEIEAEMAARRAEHEAEQAAARAKEERIRAVVDAGTATNRRDLVERRKAFAEATLAQLKADIERQRVCDQRNKH
jgi:hypothetical protein